MELDINGARIFFTLPIDLPVLGPVKNQRDHDRKLDCYDSDHRFVYLADT